MLRSVTATRSNVGRSGGRGTSSHAIAAQQKAIIGPANQTVADFNRLKVMIQMYYGSLAVLVQVAGGGYDSANTNDGGIRP